jgi:imidazolonepropionase
MLIKHLAQIATPMGFSLKKGIEMQSVRVIEDGAIYIEDGYIKLVGSTSEVLSQLKELSIEERQCKVIDGSGKCAIPGFVDSHTHFVFAGYRPEEFIKRLEGVPYMDIMKMGGGIQATVNTTRNASFEELYDNGKKRLNNMLKQGVTTVEGKSGYGLDLTCEITQLQVMEKLQENHPIDIVRTFLGAHSIPAEYKNRADDYIDYIIANVLPVIKEEGLAEFCDIFCEDDVFTIEQSKKLLLAAKEMGFELKIHADEIVPLGGGELAAEIDAISADHLLRVSDKGIEALALKEISATLLPGTAFCLNKPYAPARKLIDGGCGVALASDFNPGSCFSNSIPLLFAIAVIHMKMTVEEALTALTLNGAAALNRADSIGSIEKGKRADINLLEYPNYKFLVYHTGAQIIETVIKDGKVVYADEY